MRVQNFLSDSTFWRGLPAPSKIVCVGRNYAAHAAELNHPVPEAPLLFIKPPTALVDLRQPLHLPQGLGEVHYETELMVQLAQPLRYADDVQALAAVGGVGLALDLTLRDLQTELKKQGHPWEKAKAWDGACPVSPLWDAECIANWQALHFSLSINGEVRQVGDTAQMLHPVAILLSQMSQFFTLQSGDLVLTGTPAGVGSLRVGDQLYLELVDFFSVDTFVV